MKCVNCGKYPFCEKITNPQRTDCKEFKKRTLEQLVKICDELERSKENDNS